MSIDKSSFPFYELLPSYLDTELSKSGEWILKKHGKYLHSKYNPSKEAEKFSQQLINAETVVLFGLGLGYHLFELIKLRPNCNILVIEPNDFFLTIFKKRYPIFLETNKVSFYTNPSSEDLFEFFRSLGINQLKKIKICQIKSLIESFPQQYATVKTNFSNSFRDYMTNIYTEMEFQKIWHKNTILNFATAAINLHFNSLTNRYNKKAAILVGAGTSLSKSIQTIRSIQNKALIFSVDTALKPLLEQGITPDFVVSLDGQKANFNDFCGTDVSNINLICDITVYPQISKLPFKNIFYFETANFQEISKQIVLLSDPLTLWFKQCMGELGPARSGGNVTSSAMEIIRIMGFELLFLSGCDWGFPEIGYHCQGAPSHLLALEKSNRLNSIEKISRSFYQNRALKKATNQKQEFITTDIIMLKYADWTQNFVAETKSIKKIYSLTAESLQIKGIDLIVESQLAKIIINLDEIERPLDLPILNKNKDNMIKLYERIKTLVQDTNDLIDSFSGVEPDEIIRTKVLEYLDKHTYMKKIYSAQILHTTNSATNSKDNIKFLLTEILIQLTRSIKYITKTQYRLKEQIDSISA